VQLRSDRLGQPLRWRKPRRIFVNSMSDLYHPKVPFEFIAAVHGVAAACPQHQFLILTKRPERMVEFYRWIRAETEPACSISERVLGSAFRIGVKGVLDAQKISWPLPNVMVGVSAENQDALEKRWAYLAQVPAAVRWVSLEPLLGPVDLSCCLPEYNDHHLHVRGVDWVVVGGESGPGARHCSIGWIQSVVKQCQAAGTPVHVKQLGACPVIPGVLMARFRTHHGQRQMTVAAERYPISDSKGAVMSEWPEDLRTREYPDVQVGR
jgi:protein gp37